MDLRTFAEYGDKGTLVFLSDSTNAGQGGYTFSEKEVRRGLEDIFQPRQGQDRGRDLRLEHPPRAADHRRGGHVRPEGDPERQEHDRQRPDRPRPRLPQDAARDVAQDRRAQEPAGRPGRDDHHRQPGRAHERALAHGRERAQALPDQERRHHRALVQDDPGQRARHHADHQPPVQARGRGLLRKGLGDPRFGPCVQGRAEAHAEPRQAEILHPGARRVPPPRVSRPAREEGEHPRGEHLHPRGRRGDGVHGNERAGARAG